jgi:signal transduction histidine kinase
MDVRREIQMIFKEALHNVVKHANARAVLLSASAANGSYVITMHDDGVGFSSVDTHRGSGIRNMRARATRIGGDLGITSGDCGTTVRFEARIPSGGNIPRSAIDGRGLDR